MGAVTMTCPHSNPKYFLQDFAVLRFWDNLAKLSEAFKIAAHQIEG
jgi:hypothetical protein